MKNMEKEIVESVALREKFLQPLIVTDPTEAIPEDPKIPGNDPFRTRTICEESPNQPVGAYLIDLCISFWWPDRPVYAAPAYSDPGSFEPGHRVGH